MDTRGEGDVKLFVFNVCIAKRHLYLFFEVYDITNNPTIYNIGQDESLT